MDTSSLSNQQIEAFLINEFSDKEDEIVNLSDTEDHTEIEEECPTDFEEELIRPVGLHGGSNILTSDSETEETLNVPANPLASRIIVASTRNLKGKNGHKWSSISTESMNTRARMRNIVRVAHGPAGAAKNYTDPVDCFSLFINNDIFSKIVTHTNEEISVRNTKYKNQNATVSFTCEEEIRALLGLLLLSAMKKDGHLTSSELFDSALSGTRYVSVMSHERYNFLINSLRFDDKSTRAERKAKDKFAPIREVWECFIQTCRMSYHCGPHVAVDEQLIAFRGRCPFKMYIPSKPLKYGIKVLMLCDSKTNYMINAMPYTGKTNTNGEPLGTYYVKTLTETLWGSNRNVTMDNWFTSVPLAKDLLKKPYNMTIMGTIRKNKREIPPELLEVKKRPMGTSMFCFDHQCTLVSYKPKKNKNVLLISTMHGQGTVAASGKPDIIEFYNSTKGAVDTFDQMCGSMSCSRKTQRWPLCYFFGILNMAIINSYVIYVHNTIKNNKKPLSRRLFVKEVSEKLSDPWLRRRLETPTLTRCLKRKISEVLGETSPDDQPHPLVMQKKICALCSYKKRRMTRFSCPKCKKFICLEHRSMLCVNCAD